MKKAIVALGVEKMTVGDYLTETAADGSVTVTSNRQADLVLKNINIRSVQLRLIRDA